MDQTDKRPKTVADLSKEDQATLNAGKEAKAFLDSKFGKFYTGLLQTHLQAKRNELEAPAETSMEGIVQILRAESAKGAIMGLRLAIQLLEGMVTSADQVRRTTGLAAGEQHDTDE